jgi:hypothetical protein
MAFTGVAGLPFAAISTAGDFPVSPFVNHDPTQTSRTETWTFHAKPNTRYLLVAQAGTWFLLGDPPSGDFAGLDVTVHGVADPVFRLNPDWAAQNPAIARNVVIHRTLIPGPPQSVDIKIQPFSHGPNLIVPDSWQILPVAILATGIIDASHIDAKTVRFGPRGARPLLGSGLKWDINLDGKEDLLVFFKISDAGIRCRSTEATLTAKTVDGVAIAGSDSIRTIGCR